MQVRKPEYYDRFRCIASACPDSCCKEWDVQVDEASAARYLALEGSLGDRLRQVLIRDPEAGMLMTIEDGRCPMWRRDGLCQIQAELGEEALCTTCREFPRLRHDYGDFVELGLELSCPVAAGLILTSAGDMASVEEIPGGDEPDYDREAMDTLLITRQKMLELLSNPRYPVGYALALGLLYGYQAQSQLDGAPAMAFDPTIAQFQIRTFAREADPEALPAYYAGLEILTDAWHQRLAAPAPGPWSEALRAMARYGVERYWLQAVSDYDLIARVKMIIAGCILVRTLGGDPIATAQLYSKEIENNAGNVDAILDATYTHPAFTDDKLFWLLTRTF